MNEEQVKSAVRWVLSTFGGVIAGWFAAKGWFTIDQVAGLLNSPLVISGLTTVATLIWSLVVHKQANAIAVVDTIAKQPDSPVKTVLMENTVDGRAIAEGLPGTTTVVAGTPAAVTAAKA